MHRQYWAYFLKESSRSAPSRAASVLQRKSPRRPVAEAVDHAVREAVEASTVPVRADALLFLLTNFEQMVGFPLALAGETRPGDLREHVRRDAAILLKDAASQRPTADAGDPLSGHEVVEALARRWTDLWAAARGVWGT